MQLTTDVLPYAHMLTIVASARYRWRAAVIVRGGRNHTFNMAPTQVLVYVVILYLLKRMANKLKEMKYTKIYSMFLDHIYNILHLFTQK